MKILKITRTLTLKGTCSIEVPDNTSPEEVESALNEELNLFSTVESLGRLCAYEMDPEMGNNGYEFDVDTVDAPEDRHLEFAKIEEDLKNDDLV